MLLFPSIGNVIEPFILVGVWLIYKNSPFRIPFAKVLKSKYSIVALLFLTAMALVGTFTPTGVIRMGSIYKNIYADFRACYIFLYAFLLLIDKSWKDEQKVKFLKCLLWPIIVWGFIYSYKQIGINTEDGERTMGIPVHFLLIQTLLYYRSRNYFIHTFLLAIGAFYAVYSFARINVFLFAVQVLVVAVSLFFSKAKSFRQNIVRFVVFCVLVFALFKIVPMAYEYYLSSEGGKKQVERIIGVANSTSKTEGERTKSLYVPFTDADFFFLPEGLGWRNHVPKICRHYQYHILSTQDSCWLYLYYHFGLLGGLFFTVLLLRYFAKSFKSMHGLTVENTEKTLMLTAFAMCFFTQGIFFTVPQNALAGGGNAIPYFCYENSQHGNPAEASAQLVNHSHRVVNSVAAL